jgi:N-acetylglucosamine-6-sulfatase
MTNMPAVLQWLLVAFLVVRRDVAAAEIVRRRPNILLLITDDQDCLVGGIDHMPLLNKYLVKEGTSFSNMFVHTPICCPSRSSIFSGRYLHNGGALNNSVSGNCNGQAWQERLEQDTFAVKAHAAGYQTGFAGKYLNQYGERSSPGCHTGNEQACRRVPPGWDKWMGLVGNSVYYNYRTVLSEDHGKTSRIQKHGRAYNKDYLPDLVANRTLDMIHDFSATPSKPFLITAAWPTPHAPFTPAPQDKGTFAGAKAHRTPNYNTTRAQNAEKHWMMRRLAPIDAETEQWIDQTYQARSEALLSIDRHVQEFVTVLDKVGQLDNTIIIYTSDNGWQLGQHRIKGDKRQLYEHDIRVPLIVRGPGVAAGKTMDATVLNIDIAPTICEIVMFESPTNMDGRSLLSLFTHPKQPWRDDFLVSYHGEGDPACGMWICPPPIPFHGGDCYNNTFSCIRKTADNSMYCRFDDDKKFVEYYNLEVDPWQLHNAADELTVDQRFAFEHRLEQLKRCSGKTCRR